MTNVPQNQGLCPWCRDIFAGRWRPWRVPTSLDGKWKIYHFHETLDSLRKCAETCGVNGRCNLCAVAISTGKWTTVPRSAELTFSHIREVKYLSINITPEGAPATRLVGCTITMTRVQKHQLSNFIRPNIGTSTFSTASEDLIKRKYLTCCSDHNLCGASAGGFTPTRVLDLGSDSDSTDGTSLAARTVRLIERRHDSTTSHTNQPYATLSHCWGLTKILRLLRSNKTELEEGIDVDTLLPTFQHAIQVTRLLGLRFLWIDSLCIIQNVDDSDWEIESALMGKVYRHASVNIAAASATDARGGLFFDRDPVLIQPFAAYADASSSSEGPGLIESGWYLWKNDGRWGLVGREPLNVRGWVLQERLLSARTVHFTKSEVFWHCLEDLGSESVPDQVQDDLMSTPVMQIGDYTDVRISIATARSEGQSLSHQSRNRLYQDWKRVLVHYSKCGLTKETDRLVAIFGIADELEQLIGDVCLAGLWRNQMPSCLLWLVDWGTSGVDRHTAIPESMTCKRSNEWVAPSWSWASLRQTITFPILNTDAKCHTKVVDATMERKRNGAVICGRLTLQGPMVEVDVSVECGKVAAGWCDGAVILPDREEDQKLSARFYLQTDGLYQSSQRWALLILEDWADFFLFLEPVEMDETGPTVLCRSGVLLMEPSNNASPNWSAYEKVVDIV
ncbi:heterokaryon incompatibility protein-domain-containing protein [Podospora aff. communis PSN243]|uniref:Heterokaryon incompatibility protein-domain-containing protein n=1 Tax=Podospora aff. communis PSN243 TaxID=3040156 RepID=A0AAV9GR59_9PEZI|nr:heterokaryon incompatibility protein-domain-containing protein [Podospora aff. communis PSN243]